MHSLSERALLARINRRLKSLWNRGEELRGMVLVRKCREDSRGFDYLGQFYAVNHCNNIACCRIDLDELGQELGVI